MDTTCDFYICPTCFKTAENPHLCHDHQMIHCTQMLPGDNRLKPIYDDDGDLKARAPRWFLEETSPRKAEGNKL